MELHDMPREEKLSFFINLYNMMAIHAILVWGHPSGPLERRKLFGDFKYVIGGCTYSLSAIYNGIFRSNQRPPYNLTKPFGIKDKRIKVSYSLFLTFFSIVKNLLLKIVIIKALAVWSLNRKRLLLFDGALSQATTMSVPENFILN